MSTKRRADTDHPDWPVYIRECEKLRDEQLAVYGDLRKQFPLPEKHQLDSEFTAACRPVALQFNEQLRQLQRQYSYLFIEETDADQTPDRTDA